MAALSVLPYRCPKCFHTNRFPDVATLRTHLELDHSYVHLSITRSAMVTRSTSSRSSFLAFSDADEKKMGFKDSARELEKQLFLSEGYNDRYHPTHSNSWPDVTESSPRSMLDTLLNQTSPRHWNADSTFPVNSSDIQQPKQSDASSQDSNTGGLSRQVETHSMQIATLKSQLKKQHKEMKQKEKKLSEMSDFLENIEAKQSTARDSLQQHIEDLVNRAEHAEMGTVNSRPSRMNGLTLRTPASVSSVEKIDLRLQDLMSTPEHQNVQKRTPKSLSPKANYSNPDIQLMQDSDDMGYEDQQERQQQLDTLQQQLDQLQHQQGQLQQFLVQLSQQPIQDSLLSKTSQVSTLKRNQHVQDSKHDLSQSLPNRELSQTVLEARLSSPNSRLRHEYEDSQSSPPPSSPQSDTHLFQKGHQNQSHYDIEKLEDKHVKYSYSSDSCPSPTQTPLQKENQHQQNVDINHKMHHHYTLPRQQTAILPGSHEDRFSKSMSSTLPLYVGSELPNFDMVDEFPEEIFQKTDAALEQAGVPLFDDGKCTYDNIPMHESMNQQRGGSLSPYEPFSPTAQTDESLFSPDHSSTDTLNLKVLEEVFQEMIDHKNVQGTTNEGAEQRFPHHNSTNLTVPNDQSQSMHKTAPLHEETFQKGGDVRLTSLPSRQPVNSSPQWNEHKSNSLPNAIPKNQASIGRFNPGLTFVHDDVVSSRLQSIASDRHSQSHTDISEVSEMDSLTNVTYTASVSSYSGYAGYTGPKDRPPSVPLTAHQKYALLCIFSHLDIQSLLNCALVCQDWKRLSRHPSLWRTVKLFGKRISSQFLHTMSLWCTELEWLTLDNLRPRKQHRKESHEDYQTDIRGCLETGLEYLLQKCGSKLISLAIRNCPFILTERSLWLASCYCMNLCSVTYVSQTDPAGHEVIWTLGAGCRMIESLKIPPGVPSNQPYKFNNRCAQMIGRCWPLLKALSIGGKSVDGKGLVAIAKNLSKLQVLELDHMSKVTEPVSIAMTKNGLRGLQVLIFRHTPVTTKAILQFNSACSQLRSLSIHLDPSDYFQGDDDASADQNADRFDQLHTKLQELTKQPALRDVMHLFITKATNQ